MALQALSIIAHHATPFFYLKVVGKLQVGELLQKREQKVKGRSVTGVQKYPFVLFRLIQLYRVYISPPGKNLLANPTIHGL